MLQLWKRPSQRLLDVVELEPDEEKRGVRDVEEHSPRRVLGQLRGHHETAPDIQQLVQLGLVLALGNVNGRGGTGKPEDPGLRRWESQAGVLKVVS